MKLPIKENTFTKYKPTSSILILSKQNSTLYGIGHHWEAGFNMDADLSWKKHTKFLEIEDSLSIRPVTPLLLFNMQKDIPILPHPKLRVNIGTQMGTNIINHGDIHFAYVGYVLLASEFMEDWHINLGTYLTNRFFFIILGV